MANRVLSLTMRVITLILIVVATILTATAAGIICDVPSDPSDSWWNPYNSNRDSIDSNIGCKLKLSISSWDDTGRPKHLEGQFFVFAVELIMVVVLIAMMVIRCIRTDERKSLCEVIVLGISSFLMFAAGVVEAWYGSGFDMLNNNARSVVILGWVFASAFLLLGSLLMLFDSIVSFRNPPYHLVNNPKVARV